MHKQFQHELHTTTKQKTLAFKGISLSNIIHAKNITRSIEKLQLASVAQAGAVGRFSKYGKALGNGLIVIDVGSRIGRVETAYRAEGNWERRLVR